MSLDNRTMRSLRDGSQVLIRPIRKQDAELERAFIERLSPQSRRFRFLATFKSPSEALLRQLTYIDEEREAALIALSREADTEREVGVARFSTNPDGSAEIAVTVDDQWHGRGLATVLLGELIGIAKERGVQRLYSIDSAENHAMRDLASHLGFACQRDADDSTQVRHTLELASAAHA